MKLKNKLYYFISICFLLGFLTGCSKKEEVEENNTEVIETKAKCEVSECIKLLKSNNTPEEINEVIGLVGKKSDYSDTYTWKLTDKTSITATYNGDDTAIIQGSLDKTSIASDEADFSKFTEMKKDLSKGKSFTYDEIVTKVGGIEGTLSSRTSSSVGYTWVDKHGQTFSATFSDNLDGKCSIISLK